MHRTKCTPCRRQGVLLTEQPLFFYRDITAGKLTKQDDRERDFTDALFSQTPVTAVETSLQSRLLKPYDKSKKYRGDRGLAELIGSLCKNRRLIETLDKTERLPREKAEKLCNETLSGYGKSFTAEKGAITLHAALLLLMSGSLEERASAKAELEKIQEALQNEKANRAARVRTSIQGIKCRFRFKTAQ